MENFPKKLIIITGILIFLQYGFSREGDSILTSEKGDSSLTEVWEPVPKIVTPGIGTAPPSDAIVLFNGTDLSQWVSEKGGKAGWDIKDGIVTVKPGTGGIVTKQPFGDIQLHLEWRTPSKIEGEGQKRGNSGVFLQQRYEIQILDSYNNRTYSNGQAGSIYKQYIPLVNACRKPGEWQTYDIIFKAPRFEENGELKSPAYVTVLQNGVLIQNHVEIQGTIKFIGKPEYKKHNLKEPLMLQDHNSLVSFRNIWVREL
jgi:hypothetical protein